MKKILLLMLITVSLLLLSSCEIFNFGYDSYRYNVEGEEVTLYIPKEFEGGTLNIPKRIEGKAVTAIEQEPGIDYTDGQVLESVKKVIIPEGVKTIGNRAFSNMTGLLEVVLPSTLKEIGASAFHGCESLKSVRLAKGAHLTLIGGSAFAKTALTEITLPDSVDRMGRYALGENISRVNIPSLSMWLKMERDDLLPTPYASISLYLNGSELREVVIPDDITIIGAYAFADCYNVSSVTIHDGVTEIGSGAFLETSISEINLPESLRVIGEIPFPDTVHKNEYQGGKYLGTKNNPYYALISMYKGNANAQIHEDTRLIASEAFGLSETRELALPDGLLYIAPFAFDCSRIEKLTIPDSVISIGKRAFIDCLSLTTVNFGRGVTELGEHAFDGCANITDVVFPNESVLTTIPEGCFNECTGLRRLTLSDSIEVIEANAFYSCYYIDEISFGNGLKQVYPNAFYLAKPTRLNINDIGAWCNVEFVSETEGYLPSGSIPITRTTKIYQNGELLSHLVIPDGVTKIKPYVFYGYTYLESITISDSVASIGDGVFAVEDCEPTLKKIVLGKGLTSVGSGAFGKAHLMVMYGYGKPKELHLPSLEAWSKIVFENNGAVPIASNVYVDGVLVSELPEANVKANQPDT